MHIAVGKTSYVAIVLTRNGAYTIEESPKSPLTQTRQPAHISVVNDVK